jgi:uncharacterized protein (TIGR00297 family)
LGSSRFSKIDSDEEKYMLFRLVIGLILAVLIAVAARRAHALSRSGAAAAVVLGSIIFGLGGLGWAVLLLAFFISSSVLSRLFRKRKRALDEKFSKGSERDAGQVLANGGIAGVFALLHVFFPLAAWPWIGCAAALAGANADTWATELGVLSRMTPRLISNGKIVERGTSGGVTLEGTLAALAGSLLIALFAALFWSGNTGLNPVGLPVWLAELLGAAPVGLSFGEGLRVLLLVSLCGTAGSLVDSYFGATVQAIYHCSTCKKETERHPLHTCGTQTTRVRGLAWLDNDWVNTACTLSAALLAVGLNLWVG